MNLRVANTLLSVCVHVIACTGLPTEPTPTYWSCMVTATVTSRDRDRPITVATYEGVVTGRNRSEAEAEAAEEAKLGNSLCQAGVWWPFSCHISASCEPARA